MSKELARLIKENTDRDIEASEETKEKARTLRETTPSGKLESWDELWEIY